MSQDDHRWRPPSMNRSPSPFVSEDDSARERTWTRRRSSGVIGEPVVIVDGVTKTYSTGPQEVDALKDIHLEVGRGQLLAVRGRSGSGKTTLLNMIGGLDRPTSGSVRIEGDDVSLMDEPHLVELRRERIGFIFQAFGLIPILTAAENVEVPLRLLRARVAEREQRVKVLLELVGLAERAEHRPHELSGGEQQRVAIARALANGPQLLLADEPTGQLDSQTGRTIMNMIQALVRSEGLTAIVATHDPALLDVADRVIELSDGKIIADSAAGADAYAPHL